MRKMIQINLIKNSIAAYYAMVELHNKPNIAYRYESVTLLMINAWELALKAYIRKNIKQRSIFTSNCHTISFEKALSYVNDDINGQQKGKFTAVKENLVLIEEYRNNIAHYYCDHLEPYIFMLIAKAALKYVEFISEYFKRDIMKDDGLFIMPLGFKLPFKPEDFFKQNVAKYAASQEAQNFVNSVVKVISSLNEQGIEDSIVLGFDVFLDSVKRVTNSDLMVAISSDGSGIPFSKKLNICVSENATNKVKISEEKFKELFPYTYSDLVAWCRDNIKDFKCNKEFQYAKKQMEEMDGCVHIRRLDENNPKSSSKKYYSKKAFPLVKEILEKSRV